MQTAFLLLLGAVVGIGSPGGPAAAAAWSPPGQIACQQSGDRILVSFGKTRRPTFFGIQTPSQRFIRLRVPSRHIDVLGKQYWAEPMTLDIDSLSGVASVDDPFAKVRVFDAPGTYVLRFRNANTTEYEDLFALDCEVTLVGKAS